MFGAVFDPETMSAQKSEPNADPPEQPAKQTADSRIFPAERAFSGPSDDSVGSSESSPSVGWQEMYHKQHCKLPYSVDPDEVTSS